MQTNMIRAALAVALVSGAAQAQVSYHATDLGTLGGSGTSAQAVNTAGDVVGLSLDENGDVHGFYWHAGVMEDLGVLPGGGQGSESGAYGINDSNVVVGYSRLPGGQDRAVRWTKVGGVWTIEDLGTLGGSYAHAYQVNAAGKIVGSSQVANGHYHAFIWDNGVMTDLGILGYPPNLGYSEAYAINAAGVVMGYAYAPLWGPDHAWRYDGTQTDITPPGQFTFARGTGINTAGTACGILTLPGGGSNGFEAATYTPGAGWTELGVLPGTTESEAWGINDSGVVVGRSFDISVEDYRGFVRTGGVMIDLSQGIPGAPGAPIVEALSVNAAGQVVANADDGVTVTGLLLTPVVACYANCDASTTAPVLNVLDFNCFLNRFSSGDSYANCDGSTTAPVLNVLDFNCFLNRFSAGCP
jgi:probable HAF family extracellular repeat protein